MKNRHIFEHSEIESKSDLSINDSIKSNINFFDSQNNCFKVDINSNDFINDFGKPPSQNDTSELFPNYINSKSKKGLFKVDKPDIGINNFEGEIEKEKEEDDVSKMKKNEKINMDDSHSTYNQTQNKSKKIDDNNKKFLNKKTKRSRSNPNNPNPHNKYSYDNILKKCKTLVLNSVMEFINKKIREIYNNNIGNGIFTKQLYTLQRDQNQNTKIKDNREFLTKKLVDIFKNKISTKYTYPPEENNINVIDRLLNEKDEEKRTYFQKLFNLTFIDCLNHLINKNYINVLDGLTYFDEIIKDSRELKRKRIEKEDKEYLVTLKNYLNNYEREIYKRKPRKSKKNNEYIIFVNNLKN